MLSCSSTFPKRKQRRLVLIWISVLIAFVGAYLTMALPPHDDTGHRATALTLDRMQRIEQATQGFMATHDRRPCPADITFGQASADFGKEADSPGACVGGDIEATFVTNVPGSTIIAGGIPVRSLNLSDEYAQDAYGRRLVYVIDAAATGKNECHALRHAAGRVRIVAQAGSLVAEQVMWALLSLGKDGHGAFPGRGGDFAQRVMTGNLNPDTLTNAFVDGSFNANFTGTLVRRERGGDHADRFDDTVWFLNSSKNTCCVGPHC